VYFGFFGKALGAEPDPLGGPFGKPFGFGKPYGFGKPFGFGKPYGKGTMVIPQPGGYSKVSKSPYGFSYNTVSKVPV